MFLFVCIKDIVYCVCLYTCTFFCLFLVVAVICLLVSSCCCWCYFVYCWCSVGVVVGSPQTQ